MPKCVIVVIEGFNIRPKIHGKNENKINYYCWLEHSDFNGKKSVNKWKVILLII